MTAFASFIGTVIFGFLCGLGIVILVWLLFQFALLWLLLGGIYLIIGSIFHWF